jgi:hypothetical protein
MDSLTHGLVGALIGELSPKRIKNRQAKGALAAMAPDMANFFAYPYLGIKSGNAIPYAHPQDFYSNPWIVDHWTWIPWEISHSFFFWGFVVMPLLLWFKKPMLLGVAYASHLLLDIPSHSGIWSTVPLYPLQFRFEGWFDAWAWGAQEIFISATIVFLIWRCVAALRLSGPDVLAWPVEAES